MRLSFDDEESFKEAAGSLNFNNIQSDSDSLQGVGSSSEERNQNQNVILEVRRVPVGKSGSGSTPTQERSEDAYNNVSYIYW